MSQLAAFDNDSRLSVSPTAVSDSAVLVEGATVADYFTLADGMLTPLAADELQESTAPVDLATAQIAIADRQRRAFKQNQPAAWQHDGEIIAATTLLASAAGAAVITQRRRRVRARSV